MAVPSVTVTQIDGALGVMPPTAGRPMVVMGTATAGPINVPAAFARDRDIKNNFGSGPAVEAACYALERYGRPVVFVRTGASEAAEEHDPPGEGEDPDTSPLMTYGGCDSLQKTVAGTSAITLDEDATCHDDYEAAIRFVKDGTVAAAGIEYQWSLDGGRTWSAVTALGTATTITIPGSGGAKVKLGTGTIKAGDRVTFRCVAPRWTTEELGEALDALKNYGLPWEFIDLIGPLDADAHDTLDAALEEMSSKGKERWAICHARMPHPGESKIDYQAAMAALKGQVSAGRRIAVSAGATKTLSSVSRRRYRRPFTFAVAPRISSVSEEINVAELDLGPLPGVQIRDANGNPDEHDETVNPGLDDLGFLVARTWEGRTGVYVNRPLLFSPEGSDFTIIPYRRVANIFCETQRQYFEQRLHKPLRVSAKTGFILPTEAVEMERGAMARLRTVLLAKPKASAVSVVVSRTDNVLSTKRITVTSRLVPLAYPEGFDITQSFENPAVEAV